MDTRPIALTDEGINVLLRLAKGIETLAEELKEHRTKTIEALPPEAAPAAPALPTLEEVRAVLADLSRAGHTEAIRQMLEKRGAAKLSDIDPAEFLTLLAEAKELTNG